jgi:hypothetical protein
MVCHNCGRENKIIGKIMRGDECAHCKAEMHCCKNCRFFDPGKNNQCSEPQAEYVRDKVRDNFCDFFEANRNVPLNERSTTTVRTENARSAFDNLFKSGKGESKSSDAKNAFDKLFKK